MALSIAERLNLNLAFRGTGNRVRREYACAMYSPCITALLPKRHGIKGNPTLCVTDLKIQFIYTHLCLFHLNFGIPMILCCVLLLYLSKKCTMYVNSYLFLIVLLHVSMLLFNLHGFSYYVC